MYILNMSMRTTIWCASDVVMLVIIECDTHTNADYLITVFMIEIYCLTVLLCIYY